MRGGPTGIDTYAWIICIHKSGEARSKRDRTAIISWTLA